MSDPFNIKFHIVHNWLMSKNDFIRAMFTILIKITSVSHQQYLF